MKPVGLLYDSISNNTGDKAMGIAMHDFLSQNNIPSVIVDPFSLRADEYACLLIGGGFLLRDPRDPYYDIFRAKGEHILNGVGTSTTKDLDYLKQYRKITVRSEADKRRILAGLPEANVQVIPDPATLLRPDHSLDHLIPEGSVGIHVVADMLKDCDGLQTLLDSIPEHKVLIPFTHYNFDRRLMIKMNLQGDYQFLDEYEPRQLLSIIGRMKYVIVSSLHATIFAYLSNVPFLSFYQEKVFDYLVDRNLNHFIFRNIEELEEKLPQVQSGEVDFTSLVQRDKKAIRAFLLEALRPVFGNSTAKIIQHPQLRPKKHLYDAVSLEKDLYADVLAHRDELIHQLILKNTELTHQITGLKQDVQNAEAETRRVRARLEISESKLINRAVHYAFKRSQLLKRNAPSITILEEE